MTFETETSHPPESLPLPSEEAVFPEDSASSQPDSHPLPPGEVALGEGSQSSNPSVPTPPLPSPSGLSPSAPLLPPLSDSDQARLSTYSELGFNPTALAEHHKISILEAVTWINSPHIRPHLREIRKAFTISAALSTAKSRLTILDALEDVINTTNDLVEKRRAATTLLKAITPPRRPAKNFHTTGTPPNPSSTSPSSSRSSCPSCSTSSPSESKSAAIDSLLAFLNKDGTLNRTRLTDLAADIDRENEKALDTESDEDNEDDEDDDDPRATTRASARVVHSPKARQDPDDSDQEPEDDDEYADGDYNDQDPEDSDSSPSHRTTVSPSHPIVHHAGACLGAGP